MARPRTRDDDGSNRMGRSAPRVPGDPVRQELSIVRPCDKCGRLHARRVPQSGTMKATCTAHRRGKDPDKPGTPVAGYGAPCMNFPYMDAGVCVSHGGVDIQANINAEMRSVEETIRTSVTPLGTPIEGVSTIDRLLKLIAAKDGEVAWLRARVQAMQEEELIWSESSRTSREIPDKAGSIRVLTESTATAEASTWWRMLRLAENQLAEFCSLAIRLGIEQQQLNLARAQGEFLALAVRSILDAVHVELVARGVPPEMLDTYWTAVVGSVVPAQLRALGARSEQAALVAAQ